MNRRTIVIYECGTAGYGDRVYFTRDLVEWAKQNAPGMWRGYDKIASLDGEPIYSFEYPVINQARRYDDKSIDDVLGMSEKEGFTILFAQDLKDRISWEDPRFNF